MVLRFNNILTVKGGSPKLRQECLDDVKKYYKGNWEKLSEEDDSAKISIDTRWSPLDTPLLDLAAKYLALDLVVEFKICSVFNHEEWKGLISIVDQELFYQDNFDAPEGLKCGNIYVLKTKGGFPECLEQLLDY